MLQSGNLGNIKKQILGFEGGWKTGRDEKTENSIALQEGPGAFNYPFFDRILTPEARSVRVRVCFRSGDFSLTKALKCVRLYDRSWR